MSDRILVMRGGRIQAEFSAADATQERVLGAALGLSLVSASRIEGAPVRHAASGCWLLCAVLWALTPHFLTVSNLLNVAQQTSINAIVAVGMTFVIISGGIDLSVGSIVALSGVVLGALLQGGQPLPLAVAGRARCRHRVRRWSTASLVSLRRAAAVHRHARHDERRARRRAALHRRAAGLGLRRRVSLARHRQRRLHSGAGDGDDRRLRGRALRADAHHVRPLRLRDRRQRRGDAAVGRRRALSQDDDLRRVGPDERGRRGRADGAAQLGAADRRHDVRARRDCRRR